MGTRKQRCLRVYADASFKEGRVGIGLAIYENSDLLDLIAISDYGNSSFQAEAAAIKMAIDTVNQKYPDSRIQVLSDCLVCVELCLAAQDYFNQRIEKLQDQRAAMAVVRIRLELLSNSDIRLQWVRGHNKNVGNDYADLAANKGRSVKGSVSLYRAGETKMLPPVKKNAAFNYAALA